MSNFPAPNAISNAPSVGAIKTLYEEWLATTKQLFGASAVAAISIAAGSITPVNASVIIDTEEAAASDELTNIAYANLPDGSAIFVNIANGARPVTFKHLFGGNGQLSMMSGADVVCSNINNTFLFQRVGSIWKQKAEFSLTSGFMASILALSNAAAVRDALGLEIGSDIQAYNARLASIADQVGAADKVIYMNGTDSVATTGFTALGRSIVGAANVAAANNAIGSVAKATFTAAWDFVVGSGAGAVIKKTSQEVANALAGTSAGKLVQLNASGQLPAVSGALLTGIVAVTPETLAATVGALYEQALYEQNGYQIFPPGPGGKRLILQWGYNTVTVETTTKITLPIAWPTGYLFGACSAQSASPYNGILSAYVYPDTITTIRLVCDQYQYGTGVTVPVYWFVVGY